jgi:protein arginine N-methyltransferase 7
LYRCRFVAVQANGLAGKITIIPERSTDMSVAGERGEVSDAQMPKRADLLVSEILDTELIGEGILPTMRHAHAHLLNPGAVCVPKRATVHVQLVESATLRSWCTMPTRAAGTSAAVDLALSASCVGNSASHDVHIDRLASELTPITGPFDVFDFDFQTPNGSGSQLEGTSTVVVEATADGVVDGVVFWWTCYLTDAHSFSTAPDWIRGRCGPALRLTAYPHVASCALPVA